MTETDDLHPLADTLSTDTRCYTHFVVKRVFLAVYTLLEITQINTTDTDNNTKKYNFFFFSPVSLSTPIPYDQSLHILDLFI